MVPSWLVSTRDAGAAYEFMADVAARMRGRVQLTTDDHRPYLSAVEGAFGADIDYAMLEKIYGADQQNEKRYSPAICTGRTTNVVNGDPDPKHISTVVRGAPEPRRCACRCGGSRP